MAYNYEYPGVNMNDYNNDWLINKVKELALEWKKVQQDWTTQQEMFESLKQYILNYFENLNVQDEINNKIETMISDGTLQNILLGLVSGYVAPEVVENVEEMTNHNKLYILKESGNLWQWSGNTFEDTGISYIGALENYVEFAGRPGTTVDMNTLPVNTIYLCPGNSTYINSPFVNASFFIYTYGDIDSNVQYAYQFETNKYAWRIKSGRYSNWNYDTPFRLSTRLTGAENIFSLENNQYMIAPPSSEYKNSPFDSLAYYLFVYGDTESKLFQAVQYETLEIKYRSSAGWKYASRPFPKPNRYLAFGDSLVEGALYSKTTPSRIGVADISTQIPTRIAVATGTYNNFSNLGQGGMGYVRSDATTPKMLDYIKSVDISNAHLITIQAGRNDVDYSIESITQAIEDIIEYVQETAIYAQIVIIQPLPATSTRGTEFTQVNAGGWSLNTFSDNMRPLCEKYNVAYIDLKDISIIRNWVFITASPDGHVHPNEQNTYYCIGNAIAGKVAQIYMS